MNNGDKFLAMAAIAIIGIALAFTACPTDSGGSSGGNNGNGNSSGSGGSGGEGGNSGSSGGSGSGNGNSIKTLSGNVTISPSGNVNTGTELTASYSGNETVTYQWNIYGTAVPGGVSNKYKADKVGNYTVTVSAAGYTSKTSNEVIVEIPPTPGLAFTLIDNNTAYSVSKGTATAAEVAIPSVYNGLPVTTIDNNGFSSYTSMTSIIIPASVTRINSGAFTGCSGLTSITIPFVGMGLNGTSNTHFGYIFGASSASGQNSSIPASLKTVIITGGNSVRASAFSGCTGITSVTLPASVTSIGSGAFSGCTGLTSVTFQGTIAVENFDDSGPGDLRHKYLTRKGIGTYTRQSGSNIWSKTTSMIIEPLEMTWVPGGSFQMGKELGTSGGSDETPVHTVTLTGFYMGKYEVTQMLWQVVMDKTISQQQALASSSSTTDYGRGANFPIYCVSWYDAIVFCNKLSIAESLSPAYSISGKTNPADWGAVPTSSNATWNAAVIVSGSTGYRLPTEAQWEYAAKGGNGTPGDFTYSGSDKIGDVAWYSGNSGNKTHEIGQKAPNGLGLYDMSGNVWEWCWDWYGDYSSSAQTDPQGAAAGYNRVLRGGSWNSDASGTRSVYRVSNYNPYFRIYDYGFRLVRP